VNKQYSKHDINKNANAKADALNRTKLALRNCEIAYMNCLHTCTYKSGNSRVAVESMSL